MPGPDLTWIDMAAETTAAVEKLTANDEIFALLAGAVYALHQDTLRACAVDMARADDTAQAAAIDAAQPTPLGGFAARIAVTMQALMSIERANRGILEQAPAPGADAETAHIHCSIAHLRLVAARLWLLTMQARVGEGGGAGLRVGVAGLWSRLRTVPRERLAEGTRVFAGTYYTRVRSDPQDLTAWPLSP
jgi:hypothetical protein